MSHRTVSRWGLRATIALVVGNIVGSGIFMLPASLAPYGWNAVMGWALTLVGALCVAGVFAELARGLPTVGGMHGFVEQGLGQRAAFLSSLGYLASIWAAIAAIAVAGVRYAEQLFPKVSEVSFGSQGLAAAMIGLMTLANLRALASPIQLGSALIKILPFVLVVAVALGAMVVTGPSALAPIDHSGLGIEGTMAVIGITLFSLLGIESAAVPAGIAQDPARVVPRATLIGTGLAALLTAVSSSAVVLLVPAQILAASPAPIATFIEIWVGHDAALWVTVCAIVSCVGCVNGWLLLGAELPRAMAGSGAMPNWFAQSNTRGVAARGLVVAAAVSGGFTVLALSRAGVAAFEFAALVTTVLTLVTYVLVATAALRLNRQGRLPGARAILPLSVGALAFAGLALYSCGLESLVWAALLLSLAAALRRVVTIGT